jgi:hypothetical protein
VGAGGKGGSGATCQFGSASPAGAGGEAIRAQVKVTLINNGSVWGEVAAAVEVLASLRSPPAVWVVVVALAPYLVLAGTAELGLLPGPGVPSQAAEWVVRRAARSPSPPRAPRPIDPQQALHHGVGTKRQRRPTCKTFWKTCKTEMYAGLICY